MPTTAGRTDHPAADGALHAQLAALVTEQVDPRMRDADLESTRTLVLRMNDQDRQVADAVRCATPQLVAAVDAIAERMAGGGRLIYLGAGTSGRIGIVDASECPPTFGTTPGQVIGIIAGGDRAIRTTADGAEDDAPAGADDLRSIGLTELDSVVGISASGRTPYVLGALDYARELGALTVAVACNPASAIAAASDIGITVVVGAEFLAGSTRLKAGTATKLVLNTLSTLTMIRLGKTFGNVMVDLTVSNEKLAVRAERMLIALTGTTRDQAQATLREAGGSVRDAVLMLLAEITVEEARELLACHGGSLRAALAAAREGSPADVRGHAAQRGTSA